MDMSNDEQKIRELIDTWLSASAKGDVSQVLELMDEGVVFLVVGQPPMRGRDAFAKSFRALSQFRVEGTSDIQEIKVLGDWAYAWNYLTVTMTPISGGASMQQAGNVLSIFRKNTDGRWVLFRDANLLTKEAASN